MSARHFLKPVFVSVASVMLAILCASQAFGYVETISGNVGPTMTYLGSPTYMWNIPGAPTTDGTVDFYGGPSWSIAPSWSGSQAALDWVSPLNQDLSNPSNGLARATFSMGGTFSVTGRLYQSNQNGSALLTDSLLFQGMVLDFEIAETIANLNRIDMVGVAIVLPMGGWLFDQGHITNSDMFALSFIGVDCQQNSGNLTGFQNDIVTLSSMQFAMVNLVPEPSAGLLLIGGAALLLRRRR
jgi:hypothetical protein